MTIKCINEYLIRVYFNMKKTKSTHLSVHSFSIGKSSNDEASSLTPAVLERDANNLTVFVVNNYCFNKNAPGKSYHCHMIRYGIDVINSIVIYILWSAQNVKTFDTIVILI